MMQSNETRLRRAETDLVRAELNLARVRQYDAPPGSWQREENARLFDRAEDRVFTLRGRVAVRRDALAREYLRALGLEARR